MIKNLNMIGSPFSVMMICNQLFMFGLKKIMLSYDHQKLSEIARFFAFSLIKMAPKTSNNLSKISITFEERHKKSSIIT